MTLGRSARGANDMVLQTRDSIPSNMVIGGTRDDLNNQVERGL